MGWRWGGGGGVGGFFFFQAEDGIRDIGVTGVQTCALPISGINLRHVSKATRGMHWITAAKRYFN